MNCKIRMIRIFRMQKNSNNKLIKKSRSSHEVIGKIKSNRVKRKKRNYNLSKDKITLQGVS